MAPADYLRGLDKQVYGYNSQGLPDPSIFDPLGCLQQQAALELQDESVLRLQWPVRDSGDADHSTKGKTSTTDVWHCRLVPMAHFSYPENVTELVHWTAQQHDQFGCDFPAIARMLEAGKRSIDPRQEPATGKPRAVFFGIFLSLSRVPENGENPVLSLHRLCESIVQDLSGEKQSPIDQHHTAAEKIDWPALLHSVDNDQWKAAEARITPHKLDPLGLAAHIAQQILRADSGGQLPPTQTQAVAPVQAKGRWPRMANDCTYCDAAGLDCDYRDAPAAASTAPSTLDLNKETP